MRILLTGSHGFIGSAVKRRIEEAGKHELLCLDRSDSAPAMRWRPEAVIHCAWGGVNQGGREDPVVQHESEMLTHEVAISTMPWCRRFVGVGSQAEHASLDSPYRRAKIATRLWLEGFAAASHKSFAWARLYSVYGPGDAPTNFIPYVIRTLLDGKDVPLTDQNIPWDFLYVDDAADALVRLAESDAEGEFEIGFGSSSYTQDIAAMIRRKINRWARLLFGELPRRQHEVEGLHCNIDRIYNSAKWLPLVGLDEGLDRTIAWFRAQKENVA